MNTKNNNTGKRATNAKAFSSKTKQPLTKTFEVKVRHDGAINLRKKVNATVGIRAGSIVTVTISDGKAVIAPKGYVCSICGKSTDKALDVNGICTECNKLVVQAIKNKGCTTVAEAIAYAQDVRTAIVKK